MPETTLDIRFRTQGGQQSAAQVEAVQQSVQRAREDVERFQKSGGLGAIAVGADKIRAARTQIEALGHDLLTAEQRSESLRNELARISQADIDRGQADGLIQDLARSENAAASLREELALIPRDLREQTADSVGFLGDIDSSLQAISGAADEFGQRIGGAVGGGLQVIATGARLGGELFAVAEAAPRLFSAVDQLRENMLKAVTAATAQATAETVSTGTTVQATVAERGLSAARATAIKALGFAGVTAVAAGASFAAVSVALAEGRKEAERAIAAERDRIEAIIAVRDLNASATQERIDDLNAQIALEAQARDNLIAVAQEQLASASDLEIAYAAINEGVDTNVGLLNTAVRGFQDVGNAAGSVFGVDVESGIQKTKQEIDRYNASIQEQEAELRALNAVVGARAFVEASRQAIEAEQELNRLREAGAADEIQSKIDAFEQDRDLNAQLAETVRNRLAEIEKQFENAEAIPFEELQALDDEWRELQKLLPQIETDMHAASAASQALIDQALPFAQAREAEREQIERTQAAIDDAIAAREQENEELRREVDTLASQGRAAAEAVRASSQALSEYEDELQQQAERALVESTRASQIQALETEIAAAKQTEAERAKHAEVGKALSEAAKQQRQIVTDTQAEINELNQDFMASEIKAIAAFNRERERLEEDFEDDLLQAKLDNDVNAFIRIRDAGLKTLGREDTDFQRERQQATDERNARIAALQEGQRSEIEQLNQQTAERLETLQAAGQAELTLSQQKEQQLLDLKEQFRLEDVRLEQEQQARQRESQLSAYNQQFEDNRAALSTILSQYNAAMQMLASSAAAQGLANTALAGAVGGPVAGAFAAAQSGSTFATNLTINQTVGDVATLSQAKFIADQSSQTVLDGLGAIFRTGGGF